METTLADISALMGLTHTLKPHVVVTDQGSAFMSKYFSDFLADSQVRHWPSTTYTPQQNAYVERMWGTRFSMARALLANANLGPSWHPWALQTANWILNRLPQPSRGNLSPYFILARAPASVTYLRTFGCLVRVLVPLARTGMATGTSPTVVDLVSAWGRQRHPLVRASTYRPPALSSCLARWSILRGHPPWC